MPRAMPNLLIGGAIIMAMTRTAAAAEDAGLTIVNPPGLFDPTAYGYSQAVIAPAGARVVHISGQGGADATGALPPDFDTQVNQAFANLCAALEGVGAEPGQVAKLTIYMVDHDPSKLGTVTGGRGGDVRRGAAGADAGARAPPGARRDALRGGCRRHAGLAIVACQP